MTEKKSRQGKNKKRGGGCTQRKVKSMQIFKDNFGEIVKTTE